jgi:uncharacterized membrane protein
MTIQELAKRPPRQRSSARREWLLPAALVVFGLLPALARGLAGLAAASNPDTAPPEARFDLSAPLMVHLISGTAYAVLGAFQFSASFRRGHRVWHRRAGRVLIALGLTASLSAVWLTLFYDGKDDTGALLNSLRLLFASAMSASLVLALAAIRRRDVAGHRAWMIRGYAIALGAATQIFTLGFGEAIFGGSTLARAWLTGAGWVINLAVAEWFVRRRPRPLADPTGVLSANAEASRGVLAATSGSPMVRATTRGEGKQ